MLYLKYQSNAIKFSCVVFEFAFNLIVITFLYINIYIICNSHKCLNLLIIFSIFKSFFHYLFIIKYDFTLFFISKVLIFKMLFFVFTRTFSIIPSFVLNLYFVFKKLLIFLINVIIIVFVFSLFINVIIFFFLRIPS